MAGKAEQNTTDPAAQQSTLKILLTIFGIVFRVGLFTFGGGYAMLPVLEREFVDKRHWVSEKEMMDVIVLSESIPGAVAVDAVIMLGYRVKGVWGGVVAAIAVALPSFLVLSLVTWLYSSVDAGSRVWLFVKGVRAGVIGLMVEVVVRLFKVAVEGWFTALLFAAAFGVAMFTGVHLLLIVIAGGLIGLGYGRWKAHV